MISVTEAINLITQNRSEYGMVNVDLDAALGARIAAPVTAKLTVPPFDASAMDGYALKLSEAKVGTKLKVVGEVPAGSPFKGRVSEGEAVRIFTGGPLPDGAETIIIQENVTRLDNTITVNAGSEIIRHVRKAGIDFAKGDTLIPKGRIIGPADIALAASGNHSHLPIHRRPRVAIIASGDELKPPGSTLKPGEIIGSNSIGISALLKHWGAEPIDLGIAADNAQVIQTYIEAASEADIILPIGGASVGDYDYMRAAFKAAGFEALFEKLSVRPGKPTWFAIKGKQRVLGLPGNPASAHVCAHLFLKPLLGLCDDLHLVVATLRNRVPANGPRETYLRGRLLIQNGQLVTETFSRHDSSLVTPLAASNALIRLPPNEGPWIAGDNIKVMPLGIGPNIL